MTARQGAARRRMNTAVRKSSHKEDTHAYMRNGLGIEEWRVMPCAG